MARTDFEIRDNLDDKLVVSDPFNLGRVMLTAVQYGDEYECGFEMASVILDKQQALEVAEEIIRRVKGDTQ